MTDKGFRLRTLPRYGMNINEDVQSAELGGPYSHFNTKAPEEDLQAEGGIVR
jgi:hypothetical protein